MRNFELAHVGHALFEQPWAIMQSKLEEIVGIYERRRMGIVAESFEDRENPQLVRAKLYAASMKGQTREVAGMYAAMVGRVAVLPLHGVVTQRPGIFQKHSGGTSVEQFASAHHELVGDPGVKSIVWDVDSPGGSVAGTKEAFDKLMAVRGEKKTVAVSNSLMCSGGYYLSVAADEIAGAPTSLSGNIGVIMAHVDQSQANAREGVKVTYIYAGKYKAEGNPDEPLTVEGMNAAQDMVNDYYDQFVESVAKGRKTSQKSVRSGYGEGRALTAERALKAGIIDRVATLGDVLKSMGAYEKNRSAVHAAARVRLAEAM